MAKTDSVHGKLEKVRKPRVHISYDVETEGAEVKKELPFVAGVMGDFSGDSAKEKTLKERKFTQVEGDNFDDVMKKMGPSLKLKVPNTLKGDDSEMAVDLKFNSMEDFDPANVAKQVEPLNKLLETRNKLNDLLSKADCSEKLEEILEQLLQDTGELKNLSKELGVDAKAEDKGEK